MAPLLTLVMRVPAIAMALLAAMPQPAPAAPCPTAPTRDMELERTLDGIVAQERRLAADTPGIVVSIVRAGKLVAAQGYGFADKDKHLPVDPAHTLFRLGSITKLFTYTAAMQLAQEGRLAKDGPVDRYLGGTLGRPFGAGVTTRRLMQHRAGFSYEVLGYPFLDGHSSTPTLAQFVRRYRPSPLWRPGMVMAYTNYDASLLGHVVERIERRAYAQIIRDRVLDPMGMRETTLYEPGSAQFPLLPGSRVAVGYARYQGVLRAFPMEHIDPAAAPAGSALGTATNMACFMLSQLGEGPAPASAFVRGALQAGRPHLDYEGYLGIPIGRYRALQHGGAMGGFKASVTLVPDLDLGIFVAANSSAAQAVVSVIPLRLAEALDPGARPLPPLAARDDFAVRWRWLSGDYQNQRRASHKLEALLEADAGHLRVATNPAGFLLVERGGTPRRFAPAAPALFHELDGDEWLRVDGQTGRLYLGAKPFGRVSWWAAGPRLREAAMLAGCASLIVVVIALGRRRYAPMAAAVAGLAVAVLLPWSLDDAAARGEFLVYVWPTPLLTALRLAVIFLAVATLGLLARYRRRPESWMFAIAVLPVLMLSWHWDLFSPSDPASTMTARNLH